MTAAGFDAPLARAWLAAAAEAVTLRRDELTELDSAIGDGDHGANLSRGFAAVTAALAAQREKAQADGDGDVSPGKVFGTAGSTLISKVGGASGPLYGSALRAIGKSLDASAEERRTGTGPDCQGPSGGNVLAALRAGLAAVTRLGGAQVGDKTMVDAYAPAVEAFERALGEGATLPAAAQAAAKAAEQGAADTAALVAHKGRASYLGERSSGHQDPGATSTALLFRALADVTGGGR
ncbi:MAG TPA: dihydroxyacetone kinase subunit DhaL [Actinocrinis sp.]|nr:dihydroxyacetone kinase subunit DhaL [Actinocrinis sp.]